MTPTSDQPQPDIAQGLENLAASAAVHSNCMFQLALMLARVALEPCAELYKEETALALMGLIRAKPKSNVVRLFNASPDRAAPPSSNRPLEVVQFVSR